MQGLVLACFMLTVCVVNGALDKATVKAGDCVCATTTVSGRASGSTSAAILATLNANDCGKIYGGILTAEGHTWFEITFHNQRVWVAGDYLVASAAAKCEAGAGTVPGGCPHIVTRSEWGARAPKSISYLTHPVQYAFIHHAESSECFSQSACASQVRGFQNYHMDHNGWSDIGYSFLIGGDGSVFEGRGWDKVGAHTEGYNSVGLAFCFIGSFSTKAPPDIQIQRARQMIACGVSSGKISTAYKLRGHRDVNQTDCPGTVLWNLLKTWGHY
ncbi:unnamed protein product [Lymnaea stagnalis]|uniref:Peptidoglycan recognition protein n=1 Tax=Lymnaea stagnalis TaxID=6523 RepID=A0AAV2INS5_LYMST